jgi:alcohol dehydrogenase class IV
VRDLVNALHIPALSTYGMSTEHFPEAIEKTMQANSFKGNPIGLSETELKEILEKAL